MNEQVIPAEAVEAAKRERDDLAVTLLSAYEVFYEPMDWHETTRIADALIAAGYRKVTK